MRNMLRELVDKAIESTDTRWWMHIDDKIIITEIDSEGTPEKCCPPHYLPHKLPIGQPIEDEPCHYHENPLRMLHHVPFCYQWCQHYESMMETYRNRNS